VAVAAGSALLHQVIITDVSNQKPTGQLIYFNGDPSAATLTDNAALALSTDLLKVAARVPVTSSDWATVDTKGICDISNLGRKLAPTSGTSLYATFLADGTPTLTTTSALQFTHKFIPENA
jgi:hypothetical protein